MTEQDPTDPVTPPTCGRCGASFQPADRAALFVALANHNVAHDLVESLEASPGLREHLQFILNQESPPAPF